jgi:hypothetical protein
MRKGLALVAAGLLALTVAAPVSAEPPWLDPTGFEIDCSASNHPEIGVFIVHPVVSAGMPGWTNLRMPPILFTGAERIDFWENGEVETVTDAWHPGLDSPKSIVGPCSLTIPGGSRATFQIELSGGYFFFPGLQ